MLAKSERNWIMFISGLIWIPYCLLMLYLFFEQYSFRRFPQYLIILSLLFSCCFRCVWFFCYENYHQAIWNVVINRVAILLQFTSLTLLLMMWSRVLKVSNTVVNESASTLKTLLAGGSSQASINLLPGSITSSDSSVQIERNPANSNFNWYLYITVAVNVVVWGFILITILVSSYTNDYSLYNLNITLLAGLCCFEGLLIMIVGIRTGLRISRELSPVYLSWRQGASETQKSPCDTIREFWGRLYSLFFAQSGNRAHRLHAQAEAVQRLIFVSSVIAIFFLIRSFGFLYLLYISPLANSSRLSRIIDVVGYPFFFYQVPEVIPNLAIAIGISPPNGILKRLWSFILGCMLACWRVTTSCCIYSDSRKSTNNSRASDGQISSENIFRQSLFRFRNSISVRASSTSATFPGNFAYDDEDENNLDEAINYSQKSNSVGLRTMTNPVFQNSVQDLDRREANDTSVRINSTSSNGTEESDIHSYRLDSRVDSECYTELRDNFARSPEC